MSVLPVDMETVGLLLGVFVLPGMCMGCPSSTNLNIAAPKRLEALNGSCVMIPCNFSTTPGSSTFDGTRPTYGVWKKTDAFSGPVVYDSSKTDNIYQMNITGNLSQMNCTTLVFNVSMTYTDNYYFRILNGPFVASACNDPVNIQVNDSLVPSITVPGDLREQQSVTITCSAFTPCPRRPPKLTWTLRSDPQNHREENSDGTFTTKIQETLTLSEQHDGLNISCSASYPVTGGSKAAEAVVTLSVSYGPKDTSASISPPGPVSAGSWVNLTCSSRAKPPVSSFNWFQISSDGAKAVSEGAFYTVNATGGGVYYCVASNGLRNHTSPQVQLIIASPASALPWAPVVGGILGIVVLIGLIVCVWRFKSTCQTVKQTPSQIDEAPALQKEVENIHYGEIAFVDITPERSSNLQNQRQQQDTVYAQVNVSNGSSMPADGPEGLYSQLRK